mmetsp:Transcript_15750/g.26121  ORF Transcript_15750/g.26121 Transcript_15750/m.26121 type:complete len:349 (-) Transcript_15750:235-1281(-)|eukprot:CAMPEP_0184651518 /NCGR_PEP_ID=MMETSP0308-20130426/9159_1 /TAXON_ID=38269 /ORGANISM="Gloeochaete witrockiana, Strain SAG 46.84" /LENGTH=348 /DNA_ID=CAMNT_0027085817 /DNA_START=107 /DNA_END=1153 /DNA_ORIENTATION=-
MIDVDSARRILLPFVYKEPTPLSSLGAYYGKTTGHVIKTDFPRGLAHFIREKCPELSIVSIQGRLCAAKSSTLQSTALSEPQKVVTSPDVASEVQGPHVPSPDALERFFVSGSQLQTEEDRDIEYKHIYSSRRPMDTILQRCGPGICGFLNSTNGGRMLFGISDDGVVQGLPFTRQERDQIRTRLSNMMNVNFVPPVDPSLLTITFIPVRPQAAIDSNHTSELSCAAHALYVLEVAVSQGSDEVLHFFKNQAYRRSHGNNLAMSPSAIVSHMSHMIQKARQEVYRLVEMKKPVENHLHEVLAVEDESFTSSSHKEQIIRLQEQNSQLLLELQNLRKENRVQSKACIIL